MARRVIGEYVCPQCGMIFARDVNEVDVEDPCCTRRCAIKYRKIGASRHGSDSEPLRPIGHCTGCRRMCGIGDVRPGWAEGEGVLCVACMSDRGIPWAHGESADA